MNTEKKSIHNKFNFLSDKYYFIHEIITEKLTELITVIKRTNFAAKVG